MWLNKPRCQGHDCNNEAITLVSGKWLCGNCLIKLEERIKEIKQKLILEE